MMFVIVTDTLVLEALVTLVLEGLLITVLAALRMMAPAVTVMQVQADLAILDPAVPRIMDLVGLFTVVQVVLLIMGLVVAVMLAPAALPTMVPAAPAMQVQVATEVVVRVFVDSVAIRLKRSRARASKSTPALGFHRFVGWAKQRRETQRKKPPGGGDWNVGVVLTRLAKVPESGLSTWRATGSASTAPTPFPTRRPTARRPPGQVRSAASGGAPASH